MAFNLTLRKSFLYLFATTGLIISIIGLIMLLNLGLKTYVFTKADYPCYQERYVSPESRDGMTAEEQEKIAADNLQNCLDQRTASKQNQASTAISMLLVGLPLYIYHWYRIRAENQV